MKSFSEQDHYEILEIPRDAAREEIERAYRMAKATYGDQSLAAYSVFAEGDSLAIQERIETAYRVLSDAESRSAYDAHLDRAGSPGGVPPEAFSASPGPEPAGFSERSERSTDHQAPLPMDELDPLEEEGDEFDGPRLRRSRLYRGLEIEDISSETKINPAYLRFIEEERFSELPAPVYVRGFVTAYAHCVGLDPARVAASYMKNFDDRSDHSRRERLRARR